MRTRSSPSGAPAWIGDVTTGGASTSSVISSRVPAGRQTATSSPATSRTRGMEPSLMAQALPRSCPLRITGILRKRSYAEAISPADSVKRRRLLEAPSSTEITRMPPRSAVETRQKPAFPV